MDGKIYGLNPLTGSKVWEIFGAKSISGTNKPLVRGEAGIDSPNEQVERPQLELDTEGVWLHNLVLGGINPGGMYELYWWGDNIKNNNLYDRYKNYRNFMENIPIKNGNHIDVNSTTNPNIRAWGQKDLTSNRMHLLIQNKNHTWWNVVNETGISPQTGIVSVNGFANGTYTLEKWNTYTSTIISSNAVNITDNTLAIEIQDLTDDTAYKPLFSSSEPTPVPTLTQTPTPTPSATTSPTPIIVPSPNPTPVITPDQTCNIRKQKADFTCNRSVDLSELSLLSANWNKASIATDANGDGISNLTDLSILAANWGKSL